MKILSECEKYKLDIKLDTSGKTYEYKVLNIKNDNVELCSDGFKDEKEALENIRSIHRVTNF